MLCGTRSVLATKQYKSVFWGTRALANRLSCEINLLAVRKWMERVLVESKGEYVTLILREGQKYKYKYKYTFIVLL